MSFATDGSGTFFLNAFEGATFVGSASAVGVIPSGFSFPEGTISFGGATFNFMVLTSPSIPYFAIDNVSVTTGTTPEPSSLLLMVSGLLGVGATVRRRVFSR